MSLHRFLSRAPRLALTLAASLVLLAPLARAQGAPPSLTDSLRWDPTVRRGVLPNGIRWFVKKNVKPEDRVSLRLAVPVGSTAEADDQQGLAHFTEHMNFNGSAHFKDADDLVGFLRSIGLRFGADANAYTSFDETVYMLDVPTDRDTLLDTGLDALSDFAGRATESDKEIDKERGVVMEEWRLGRGAQERIQRQQFPVIFHDSRYAVRLPIGKPDIIQGASYGRLRDFYKDWYRPEWMAVIAIGDVDPDKMERLIREHFSDLPKRTDSREVPRYDVPAHAQTLFSVVSDKEATESSVTLLCKRPRRAETTVGIARDGLKAALFTTMLNARFDEIAHRANPPFLEVAAGNFQFTRSTNLYYVQALVKDGQQLKGFESLLEETARVRAHGFLASELERAKREQVAQLQRAYAEREKTESRSLAASMVSSYLNGEPETGIEAGTQLAQALLPGITLAEVNALADTLISTRNRVVVADGPEKAGVPLPTEAELRASLERMGSASPAAWVDASAGRSLMAKLPVPGKVASKRVIDELGVTVVKFGNGVEAWLKPTDFKADEIQFTSYARGGLSLADSAAYVGAWMSPFIVNDNGVGGFKNTELQKMLAGKILRVSPYANAYLHGVNGSTRPEDLETALQVLHLGFVKPTEDPAAFTALQAQINAFLANRANSPDQVFADSANAVNTGGLYLTRVPSAQQVGAVQLASALEFYKKRFANAADFTFFFAGTFRTDSLIPMLARYLGSLPSTGKRTSTYLAKGPRFPDGITKVEVKKGSEPKGSVRITFFTHAPIEELDQHRANTAADILTDHLRSSLRELLGGTYSVSARFQHQVPLPGYSTMTVAFGCDPARADTLIAATLAEIQKLSANGPSAEDLSKEQEVQRRELETNLKQNGFWTGALQITDVLGWDPRRIAKRKERIDLLTTANLHDTYKKYFPTDHYSVVRLAPETTRATP
ncbi:MAG TPA: insulinase family protein [Candidatus Eisenbacteria bacterium]|jgi:zinc protease